MSPLERLLAEQACQRIVLMTAYAVDEQDYAGLARLFTPDGILVRPDGSRLEGRAAITAVYAARDPDRLTRHLISNHLVDVHDAGRASSRCAVQLWTGRHQDAVTPKGRPADPLQLVGEFIDELVLTAEGWRIRQRQGLFTLHLSA